jgi:putative addiction module component (TIGR02574 family)
VGVTVLDPFLQLAECGLALPPEERVRLLDLLLESLQESTPSDVQEAWDKEIERRIAAHERGEVKVYDLDEVMDEARRLAP